MSIRKVVLGGLLAAVFAVALPAQSGRNVAVASGEAVALPQSGTNVTVASGQAVALPAQSGSNATVVSLAVDQGVPLRILLTEKVSFRENAPVYGNLIEPVYAFDREVIPSGARVEGVVTGFERAGSWRRISAMLGGDFTPQREPVIVFRTVVLSDGTRIPIETRALPGAEFFVEAGAGSRSPAPAGNSFAPGKRKSGKEMVRNWLWGMSPYHPQYLAAGAPIDAVLTAPLDFGVAELEAGELDDIGSGLPDGLAVFIRLVTPLNSKTAAVGTPVEAVTIRPIFSDDHHLVLPVGARVRGQVTQVERAKRRHRNGQMAFTFTSIEPPELWVCDMPGPLPIDGSLAGIEVGHDMRHLRLSSDGLARIVESKKRFIGPAWALFRAGRTINATADPFGTAVFGAYRGKFFKEVTGGSPGFGLPASVAGAMVPPVGIGFGFYSAARSIYSTFLKRGAEIDLPVNTELEIRLNRAGD